MYQGEQVRKDVTRYVVNAAFNRAALFFADGSYLELEHTSRSNRWARPSADGTTADRVCQSLGQFRLNAKHLELFFNDGTKVEFLATRPDQTGEGGGENVRST
jgi:hypothetical protein